MHAINFEKRSLTSACPGIGNSNRLLSLWDIVHQFKLGELLIAMSQLAGREARFKILFELGNGNRRPGEFYQSIVEDINYARRHYSSAGFTDTVRTIDRTLWHLENPSSIDLSTLCTELTHIREALFTEGFNRTFLQIPDDRVQFVDRDALFGENVLRRFPSAQRDITEAGNCLATENSTAAVFHLMRAAEFALRAVARDRRIVFSDKPLEQKEWGQILTSLDKVVADMRQADKANWETLALKDAQIRFFSEVVQELRAFNDAWRRHVSHADATAFYDSYAALSIFAHVRLFMQKVSKLIGECDITPLFWDSTVDLRSKS